MTIRQAIRAADLAAPNELEHELKLGWLSGLDGAVITDVLEQHEPVDRDFPGYDGTTDEDTELLVPQPFDELYPTYLVARIHLENAEFERYNNHAMLFSEQLQRWKNYVVRHHRPRGVKSLGF